jgi:hypothetical protein
MSRKALEWEHLFPYKGFMRGTYSYTEYSERHAMEGSQNGAFFIGLHKRNLRHLARESSANMFIGQSWCPLTG